MVFVSVTRLRLRATRFLLPFIGYAIGSALQAMRADGNVGVKVRKTSGFAFWTLTLWRDEAAMKVYRGNSPHRKAMPKLAGWCDEAAFAHWRHEPNEFPSWDYATEQLRANGRLSKVLYPSESQKAGKIVTN